MLSTHTHSSITVSNHCHENSSAYVTHIEGHLQNVLGDLHDARVAEFTGHTHPGVGRGHGIAQLLDGDDDRAVRNH